MVMGPRGQDNYGLQDTGRIFVPITDLAGGGVPPAAVTVAPFRGYAYTITDNSYFQVKIPADWAQTPNTVMTYRVRWACNETYAAASGEVQWRAAYETVANDESQVVGVGTTATVDSGDINLPTLARELRQDTVGTGVAANLAAGDTIAVTLSRIALVGGANPTAEPEIYDVWIQYTRFISNYK